MNRLFFALLMLVAIPTAGAQDEQDSGGGLQEITVTAQKVAENLQTVPLSITAFSGEELEAQGISDLKGITERTPGFSMGEFNPGQTQLYVRGIGSNEDGAGGDPSVVVFVDEVYIGRSAGQDVDLYDLERVEVLRGPQGTLFGRNVVGGAISAITKKPSKDPEYALEGGFGNYGAVTLRGLASGPISENVFGKVSFSSRRRDGYLENEISRFAGLLGGTGTPSFGFEDRIRKVNRDSIRAALRWVPNDAVEVNFSANYATLDEHGAVRHYIPGAATNLGRTQHPQHSTLIPNYDRDIYKVLTDDPGRFTNEIVGLTARVDWNINPNLTFTSLTSHREVDAINLEHGLGSPRMANVVLSARVGPFVQDGNNDYIDSSITQTQEFRLASAGDTRLRWVAGLFFLKEDTFRVETTSVAVRFVSAPGVLSGMGLNLNNAVGSDSQDFEGDSFAVFGQVNFDFTDRFSGILGGRWTQDDKEIRRVGIGNTVGPTTSFSVSSKADWSEFTGKAGLNFKVSDDAFLYGTVSQGYKAGGYQGLANTAAIAGTPFGPESATLYEIGAKTEWFDNRLRANLSLFKTDYEDLQILQLLVPTGSPPGTPGSLLTQNAANAEVTGAELEFVLAPTDRLTIQGGITKLNSEFLNFFIPAGFSPPTAGAVTPTTSRIGKELRNAPDLAYNVLARYQQPLANGASMHYQIDFRHKDEVNSDPDNLSFALIPEYDLSDLRIGWTSKDGGLEIEGWVSNLFDEKYFIHNFPNGGDGFAIAGPPRMYGLTVTWRSN